MTTYRIDLAYDGTDFHGYAKQPNVRTVQGDLETALFRMTGQVETVVAGRTDRGVHATAQVLSFESARNFDTGMIRRSLNRQLGPQISVTSVSVVEDSFNARFSAIGRAYTYLVLNRDVPDPFLARTSLHYRTPLDVALMNKGVACLVGLHDFAAFCRKAPNRSTERRLDLVVWTDRGAGLLALDVAGSSFCHQMVRSLAQVSIEVGRRKIQPEAVQEILESKDRRQGKGAARAHGLTLVSVRYD